MRILKYIFLLIVLFAVAIAVFVATQKGDFEVTQTRLINTPRNIAFSYVNDFRNWEQWAAFDDEMEPEFPAITSGKGASFSWEGNENDGEVQTIFVKENDSIAQEMEWNGLPAEMYWTFKDSAGKTKVTLKVRGKIGFMPKVYAALEGGANKIMEGIFDKSLAKLDKTLDYEINTYKIKVDGIAGKAGNFYLKQSITSTIDNMPKNMRVMKGNMTYFFKKNNIAMAGKPFVMYDYYDTSKGLTKFSVCIPVAEEIFISPGSDISSGKFSGFKAVKTTLTGDYSHLKEAWDKTFAYIQANHITEADAAYLEVYKVGKEDAKGPSKWVTEIYIPIKEAAVPVVPIAAPVSVPAANPNPPAAEPKPADEDFHL
jgi:effector-binding domain-containing protein/uncharacterized protein YndB with AHSA1/START domain